jgi:hypothetical protein
VPGAAVPRTVTGWERLKRVAGGAKYLAAGAAERVANAANNAGASAASAAEGIARRVGAFGGQAADRPPLVSVELLYKVGLAAAWSAGSPTEAEVQQINEWLASQLPEVATRLKDMRHPDEPMEAAALFRHAQPPQQVEGKVLLLQCVRQFFARSSGNSEQRRQFLVEMERWTGLGADQLAGAREQLDAVVTLEQQGLGWTLAGHWGVTSAYAAAGGGYFLSQTAWFGHYLGDKAVAVG